MTDECKVCKKFILPLAMLSLLLVISDWFWRQKSLQLHMMPPPSEGGGVSCSIPIRPSCRTMTNYHYTARPMSIKVTQKARDSLGGDWNVIGTKRLGAQGTCIAIEMS